MHTQKYKRIYAFQPTLIRILWRRISIKKKLGKIHIKYSLSKSSKNNKHIKSSIQSLFSKARASTAVYKKGSESERDWAGQKSKPISQDFFIGFGLIRSFCALFVW